jgi:hypothetical protein
MPEGSFVGGPLDGLTYTLRSDTKVLAADPEQELAWLYVRDQGSSAEAPRFTLDMTPGDADPTTGARAFDEDRAVAATEFGYDVIVLPGDPPTQEEIDEEEVLTDGE